MRRHCCWLVLTCLLGPTIAQTFAPLVRPIHVGNPSAFDTARRRLVMFDEDGTTWELDGGDLRPRTPQNGAPQPAPRTGHALCYDEAQRRVLMFGGVAGSLNSPIYFNDTWAYDGSGWTQITGGPTPPARALAAMTWDATRNRMVMWGGGGGNGSGGPAVIWLNDTWEHDGTVWLQRFPATSPTLQNGGTMVFDRQRNVAVMVMPPVVGPAQTWEWNGTNWSLRDTGSAFTGISGTQTMAYDPLRNRTVIAGADFAIREWDGTTWSATTALPAFLRQNAASWFDPNCGCVTLAGGRDSDGFERADRWQWNGQTLTQVQGEAGPRARDGVMFADPPRGRVVHFGGSAGPFAYLSAETWALTNGVWSPVPSPTSPIRRIGPAATHDLLRSESLLFGGLGPNGLLGDTWSLTGAGWVPRSTTGPSPRANAAMAADLVRGVVVLFGGRDFSLSYDLSDTWEWDGTVWTQRPTTVQPSSRYGAAMAFLPALGSMLLFGGRSAAVPLIDDTWTWNGTQWTLLTPPTRPAPLDFVSMSLDSTNGQCTLVGTFGPFASGMRQQVWRFDGSNWAQQADLPVLQHVWHPCSASSTVDSMVCMREIAIATAAVAAAAELTFTPGRVATIGAGCGTPASTLMVRSRPRIGATTGLELVANPSRAVLFGLDLASGSTPLGGGCTVWLSPGFLGLFQISNASGFAEQPLLVPANPALRGLDLFAQAAALEPLSSNGLVLTQGLRLTLGD